MRRRMFAGLLLTAAGLLVTGCGSSSTTSSSSSSSGTGLQTGNPSTSVTLSESGSTLLLPYLQLLVQPLQTAYPNITLAPSGGGSGKGISDATSGASLLGGSDAYLSPGQLAATPKLVNIPIAISSQAVDFNLPGIKNLNLSGDVIAKIYMGQITKWNDPAIAALNSGVSLPSTTIVPLVRQESSGDTFIFTSFLSATNSAWASGPGFGTHITWPTVAGEQPATGNPGMVSTCAKSTYVGCIAYVGISAESTALAAGLGEAMLQNKAGNFVLPTSANVSAAAQQGSSNIPSNLVQSLIYEDGAQSYPIVNFEYIITRQTQPSSDDALAVRTFLAWAIDPSGGSQPSFLAKKSFVGLKSAVPASVVSEITTAIASISS